MDKRMVFIHMDAVPMDVDFEKLTDKQVYYLAKTSEPIDVMIFSSIEDFMNAFNCEYVPCSETWWGRIIDFSEFEKTDDGVDRERLLQETIALLSADIYDTVYDRSEGWGDAVDEIIFLAKKFEEELKWQKNDERDYIEELEKFEEKVINE